MLGVFALAMVTFEAARNGAIGRLLLSFSECRLSFSECILSFNNPSCLQSHVQALACTGDGAYVATCAARDSTVAIYKLSKAGSAKLRIRKAVGHILLSHAPVRLMCCDDAAEIGNDSRTFLLLAITGGGTVEVWRCAKAGKRVEALRVCSVSDASTSDSILAADLASMRSASPFYLRRAKLGPQMRITAQIIP